ncbi:hypothetical protein ScPMuIL_017191 [Solemya velum]
MVSHDDERNERRTFQCYDPSPHTMELFREVGDEDHTPHDLFCQMDVLRPYGDDMVWKEMARWVKYEEDLEEGGKRWSKPHVSSLPMEAMLSLQDILSTCPVLLDLDSCTMYDIVDKILESWCNAGLLKNLLRNHARAVLLKRHKHQHVRRKHTKIQTDKADILRHVTQLSDESRPSTPTGNCSMNGEGRCKCCQGYIVLNNCSMNDEGRCKYGFDSSDDTPPTPRIPRHAALAVPPSMESLSLSPKVFSGHRSYDHFNKYYFLWSPKFFTYLWQPNHRFMRKIPCGAEVVNIMVGELEELDKRLCAFVRLRKSKNVGDITEVRLPTRFLMVVLVPKRLLEEYTEVGRCLGTLLTDEIFREVAYKSQCRDDLMIGVRDFTNKVTLLPPGSWDPNTRIDPPEKPPSQAIKRVPTILSLDSKGDEEDESHGDDDLQRTGRLFGGLIEDVKRKLMWYKSDFTDALHVQCVATFIFLFLATLTPNVTFGGLLGQATDNYMGTMECILAAAINGVVFALFAGQPLNILGSTGPMLVLEMILYSFCKENEWDFLPLRVWVGMWTALMLLVVVAFDLSALIKFITRFTEESFACLIALIFIYQAVAKLLEVGTNSPVHLHPGTFPSDCFCVIPNLTVNYNSTGTWQPHNDRVRRSWRLASPTTMTPVENLTVAHTSSLGVLNMSSDIWNTLTVDNCTSYGGALAGGGCDVTGFVPDVFFLSLILFFGTVFISVALVKFRNSLFFPNLIRQTVGDFAVLIAIIVMVGLDIALGIPTDKLNVPAQFKPTRPDRGWFINPLSERNPWWLTIASVLPAILATILIYMDQQITAVIVNRKENKLKKGVGYHLDLLVISFLVLVMSLLGLPWYVAATVTALAHVTSLKKESECSAPGERPIYLGVREQRVTALLVGIFSGLAVLITSVLKFIPMPVLYGVFFYMGVSALNGMQLVQRVLLIFMPNKYQPDYSYLRHVPLRRVHLFTAIQIICLALLWVIKSVKTISIAFPVMVLGMCFIRRAIDWVFTQRELKWLDDLLPTTGGKSQIEKEEEDFYAAKYNNRIAFHRSMSLPVPNDIFSGQHLSESHSLPYLTDIQETTEIPNGSATTTSKRGSLKTKLTLKHNSNPSFYITDEDKDNK